MLKSHSSEDGIQEDATSDSCCPPSDMGNSKDSGMSNAVAPTQHDAAKKIQAIARGLLVRRVYGPLLGMLGPCYSPDSARVQEAFSPWPSESLAVVEEPDCLNAIVTPQELTSDMESILGAHLGAIPEHEDTSMQQLNARAGYKNASLETSEILDATAGTAGVPDTFEKARGPTGESTGAYANGTARTSASEDADGCVDEDCPVRMQSRSSLKYRSRRKALREKHRFAVAYSEVLHMFVKEDSETDSEESEEDQKYAESPIESF